MPGLDTRLDWDAIEAVAGGRDGPNRAPATETPAVTTSAASPGADPLAGLLPTPLRTLTAPLAVASRVLGCTIYLCANEHQVAAVRAQGGIPYAPEEIELLWELHQAVGPDVWATRLRAIHAAKRSFEGATVVAVEHPEAKRRLWALLSQWATLEEATRAAAEVRTHFERILDVFRAYPAAETWYREWKMRQDTG